MTPRTTRRRKPAMAKTAPEAPGTGTSKLDLLVALIGRPEGASLAELVAATGWQSHSVRGALAGALKRKGHDIRSEKAGAERRWRIGGAS